MKYLKVFEDFKFADWGDFDDFLPKESSIYDIENKIERLSPDNFTKEELDFFLDKKPVETNYNGVDINYIEFSKENDPVDFKITKLQDSWYTILIDDDGGPFEGRACYICDEFLEVKRVVNWAYRITDPEYYLCE